MIYILFLLSLSLFSCSSLVQKAVESEIESQMNRMNVEMLNDGKMHLVLVGTGGPIYNKKRLPTSTAIIAGGQFILVDVGPGTVRNADLLNLPMKHLSAVFLTHFHSDHISDLVECNFWSAAMGRERALEVFGPKGVEDVVNGFNLAYKLDSSYRIAHHGPAIMPPEVLSAVPETVLLKKEDEAELFFNRNGLKAYAFLVDHSPVEPAYGYRFECHSRCGENER